MIGKQYPKSSEADTTKDSPLLSGVIRGCFFERIVSQSVT